MRSVLTARPAEFAEFQPARRGFLILGGGVIAVLAITTLQRNNLAGHLPFPFRLPLGLGLRGLVRVEARKSAERLSPPSAEKT
jgi:hypothetical protein